MMNNVHGPCARRGSASGPARGRLSAEFSVLLLLAGALLLSGCGVRGSLEAPATGPTETGNATPGTPGQPVPSKPSILDPLVR